MVLFFGEVEGPLLICPPLRDMGRREISVESLVGCQICPELESLDSNGDRISPKVSTGERQSVAEFEEDELIPVFSCLEYVNASVHQLLEENS